MYPNTTSRSKLLPIRWPRINTSQPCIHVPVSWDWYDCVYPTLSHLEGLVKSTWQLHHIISHPSICPHYLVYPWYHMTPNVLDLYLLVSYTYLISSPQPIYIPSLPGVSLVSHDSPCISPVSCGILHLSYIITPAHLYALTTWCILGITWLPMY